MPDGVNVNDGTGSKILTDEVTTVDGVTVSARHAQQVKVGHGADGAFEGIRAASPLEVRLYAAGGVAISDDSGRLQTKAISDQLPSSLGVGGTLNTDLPNVTAAAPLEVRLYDVGGTPVSTDSNRLQVKAISDQLPSSLGVGGALSVIGQDFNVDVGLWNGTGADGARTTTYSSANQTNKWARGLVIHLHVSAVPGGDTVKVRVNTKGVYGTGYVTWESPVISTAIDRVFFMYPSTDPTYMPAGLQVGAVASVPLAKTFNIAVVHSGSGSFTYDLSYSLVQ